MLSLYGTARDEKLESIEVGRMSDGASFERAIGISASGFVLFCAQAFGYYLIPSTVCACWVNSEPSIIPEYTTAFQHQFLTLWNLHQQNRNPCTKHGYVQYSPIYDRHFKIGLYIHGISNCNIINHGRWPQPACNSKLPNL